MKDKEQKPPDLSERTKGFALRIIKMFSALPKSEVARVLGKQVLRAGTSVGANYRELTEPVPKPNTEAMGWLWVACKPCSRKAR